MTKVTLQHSGERMVFPIIGARSKGYPYRKIKNLDFIIYILNKSQFQVDYRFERQVEKMRYPDNNI